MNAQLSINSRLGFGEEYEPKKLATNAGLGFAGEIPYGKGFLLLPEEYDLLIRKNIRNVERIFPYQSGDTLCANPDQSFDRYVISFGQMSLEEASQWPDLLSIVREKVKPEREKQNRERCRQNWWLFGENRPGLNAALGWWNFGRNRPALKTKLIFLNYCLTVCRTGAHVCFSFQPTNWIFSDSLAVFPSQSFSFFSVLQSHIHENWARFSGSSFHSQLRYKVTSCFHAFPFPVPDPRTVIPSLESFGEALYRARQAYMLREWVGLTTFYNRLKDPSYRDPGIDLLREGHEELDRLVLVAYGWQDLRVPKYVTRDASFEREIISRLVRLNAVRSRG